jgi:hypothetical protein
VNTKIIIRLAWYKTKKEIGLQTKNVPSSTLSDFDVSTVLLPARAVGLTQKL